MPRLASGLAGGRRSSRGMWSAQIQSAQRGAGGRGWHRVWREAAAGSRGHVLGPRHLAERGRTRSADERELNQSPVRREDSASEVAAVVLVDPADDRDQEDPQTDRHHPSTN